MQPHPDRGELKLYLRGYAPAPIANVIKQHLMVCDKCVSDALVEYDHLDKTRAAVTTPADRVEVTALIPAARATIVINGPEPRLRYAWAALLPIAATVGLIWTAFGREDRPQLLARLRTAPVVEQFQLSGPSPQISSLQTQPTEPIAVETAAVNSETAKPKPVRRTRTTDNKDSMRQAAPETRVARFYVVSARSSAGHPILLQPIEVQAPVVRSESLHSSAALSLVSRTPSLAPPPQRRGIKRVFSVLAAPFRKS